MHTTSTYRMKPLRIALALISLLSLSAIARAQAPAAPSPAPAAPAPAATVPALLANLTMPLDVSRAKVGTRVEATVVNAWSGNGCDLRKGALVEGHVSQVKQRTKTDKRSGFVLVFDKAECDRHRGTPFKTTIFAMIGPPGSQAPNGESGMGQTPPLTDVPNSIGGGMRKISTPDSVYGYSVPDHLLPAQWHAGQVVDVPMNLSVGSGADGGSIIWTVNKDARLEGQTTLILMATR